MKRNYYITKNGRLKRQDNTLYLEFESGERKVIPIEDVEGLYLMGETDLNTKLLNFLAQQKIRNFSISSGNDQKCCTNYGACAINMTHAVSKVRDSHNSPGRKESHRFSIIGNHRATISTPPTIGREDSDPHG